MELEIQEVKTQAQLKTFIYLAEKVYKGESRWVPPFYADEWAFHDIKKNKALNYCEVIRFLCIHQGEVCGRVMGIIHHPYNAHHKEKTARFFNLDSVNNIAVVEKLLAAVSQWAKQKGMHKLIGPFGFSDKDAQGYQVEGFHFLPVLATPANPSYLPELLLQSGFSKQIDCVSYQMGIPPNIPLLYERVTSRLLRNQKFSLIEFKSKFELKPYILPVLRLVNESYTHLFGFSAMSEEEMKKLASQYLPVLDPAFVKVIVNDQKEVIAFVVAIPDMSEGIQKARGRLFPFGFFYILQSMKKSKQLNLMLGAIKENYRGLGLSALLGKALLTSALKRNMEIMDSHLILENNWAMRGECEKLGGEVRKRFRIFYKPLL